MNENCLLLLSRVRRRLALVMAVMMLSMSCDTTTDPNNNNGNGNNNGNNNNSNDMPFETITATERMVEGQRLDDHAGTTRTRDEEFTATYTIMPASVDTREVIINFGETTTAFFGDITGQAHCTYQESGTDVDMSLMCTTTDYAGMVEWDTTLYGSYDYIPALGTITLIPHATDVSSPEYTVTFTTPGCPELDSMDPSIYDWQGPGQGVWGFVDIVLENGHFQKKLDNPLADDLGALDFYEIELNTP